MMPRIHAGLIFTVSFMLMAAVYFVDESTYSFNPLLASSSEQNNFLLYVFFNAALSLGLYAISLQTRYKRKSLGIALVAFLPLGCLIVWNLIF